MAGRHLSPVQFKASVILAWIEDDARTKKRLDGIKMSLVASGTWDPHGLFPQEIEGPKTETLSTEGPLPEAAPDRTVRYELEAPVQFGEQEYERLMSEIAQARHGSIAGDDVSDRGWV